MFLPRSLTWTCTWKRFMVSSPGGRGNRLGRLAAGGGTTGLPLAAVLHEIAEQAVHLLEIRSIDQVAAGALLGDHACAQQFLQVERQRRRRHLEVVGAHGGRGAGAAR